jgi:hypothetical protein
MTKCDLSPLLQFCENISLGYLSGDEGKYGYLDLSFRAHLASDAWSAVVGSW